MQRTIITTGDGSKTIHLPEWNENYHSSHGAVQEAKHVFLKHGLELFLGNSEIHILEVGFGTGLNTILTLDAALHSDTTITPNFTLTKIQEKLQNQNFKPKTYDIIYFDAFGPRVQEDMWTKEIFQKLYTSLKPGGYLVTYCAKGQVKRDLKSVGFFVEALPGPPGKREMTRGRK